MRDAFANASGAPDVLLWRGLQNLGDDVVSPWLDLLRDRDIVGRLASGTAFCAVLPGPLAVQAAPEPDVGLAVVWWWGFPVIGELGQVRRSLSEPRNALIDDWKDAVLPPFAGENVVLLEELYSLPALELSDIVAQLKSWALRNEWTPEFLTRCGALHIFEWSPASEGGDAPPLAFRNLWCCGALQVCSATGPALHPAALAVLGQNARLSSIVLRAQSTLVLPMLEEARLAICTVLTRRYGPRWVVLREPADAVEAAEVAADPLRCQWGHLRSVLWAPELVDHRTLLGVADEAWAIRNSLAHLRPITFARFEQFHNQIIRAWSLLPPQRTNRRTATISGVSRGVSAADGR